MSNFSFPGLAGPCLETWLKFQYTLQFQSWGWVSRNTDEF